MRLDLVAADVAAGSADHLAEHRGQPRRPARLAPVELDRPVRALLLAAGADQDLAAAGGRSDPGALALVRVVRATAAQEARRGVLGGDRLSGRAHGWQG